MIRFTVSRLNPKGDSLAGLMEGTIAPIRPRLMEPSEAPTVDVSAEEAIAISLVAIRRTLDRILQKLEAAHPEEDQNA